MEWCNGPTAEKQEGACIAIIWGAVRVCGVAVSRYHLRMMRRHVPAGNSSAGWLWLLRPTCAAAKPINVYKEATSVICWRQVRKRRGIAAASTELSNGHA